jgi:hypothetical protein
MQQDPGLCSKSAGPSFKRGSNPKRGTYDRRSLLFFVSLRSYCIVLDSAISVSPFGESDGYINEECL